MEDDEPISVMLQAVRQKKKSMKKSESSPDASLCCPISPDQRDLQAISGLLNLQSTSDHPQEQNQKQKHEISTQHTSLHSAPVQERESKPKSITGAGRKRGRKCEERHVNSDHPKGNGCQQHSEGVLGHSDDFACQPNILQEKYVSSQSYQNDAEKTSSKDHIILSASKRKKKKMNTTATKFAFTSNSDLHSGRECASQKISQDPRSDKKINGQNEAGDLQRSIEGEMQLDGQVLCTTSVEDDDIEPNCQWDKLSKKIETFASKANILQEICGDKANLGIGKCLVLDEEKREFIAQEMARSCQNDARLRHMFLESLNALVEGGLLESVALKVLSEGPCEAAQEVIDMLEKRKTEPDSAQHLIALLQAFENLHQNRAAFQRISHLQDPNIFSMRHISQGSWEIKWNANSHRRP